MHMIDCVIGCSFGDEGKGKVVFDLLQHGNYNLCVRFNGAGNAGHTIYLPIQNIEDANIKDEKIMEYGSIDSENDRQYLRPVTVHQLPVGVLKKGVYNLIASDCVVNVDKILDELEYVQNVLGIETKGRLMISRACHVITSDMIEYDRQHNKVGTTGSGVGPTYAHKMFRDGIRVDDGYTKQRLEDAGVVVVDMRNFWYSSFVRSEIQDVLMEGAQGFELDINWTDNYPFCTSSTCTLGGAVNTGFPLQGLRDVYGVTKAYDTYVGYMNFQPDFDEDIETLCTKGNEYGSTSGRKRQCNYMNLGNLIQALRLNNCNQCIINKVDIIQDTCIFKLYDYDLSDEVRSSNCTLTNTQQTQILHSFVSWLDMRKYIIDRIHYSTSVEQIIFSGNPYSIE